MRLLSKKMLAVVLGTVAVSFAQVQAFSNGFLIGSQFMFEKKPDLALKAFLTCPEDRYCQAALGNMYMMGEGVEKDHEEAIKWYRKAADNGDHEWSELVLAGMLEDLELTPEIKAESLMRYKNSALNGSSNALAAIGEAYTKGRIVTKNKVIAYAFSKFGLDARSHFVSETQVEELWAEMNKKERKEAEALMKKMSKDINAVINSLQ